MQIVIASRNPGKIKEVTEALFIPGIEFKTFEDFETWPSLSETGKSFEENAVIKARGVADFLGMPGIADDSGLLVDALGGRPGIFSSRYAGPEGDSRANIRLLLKELKDVPLKDRKARFVCVVALAMAGEEVRLARGECEGTILTEPRGKGGFGYDPVFLPSGFDRTMAELSLQEKNSISHRGKALAQMRIVLERLLQSQG
ncbi:MAG: XTP/dITP diphosphatase [Actinomycetota bacterium]|nr:XTP/dITP diphosphatase [Actinomycetota bacterium]